MWLTHGIEYIIKNIPRSQSRINDIVCNNWFNAAVMRKISITVWYYITQNIQIFDRVNLRDLFPHEGLQISFYRFYNEDDYFEIWILIFFEDILD